MARTKFINTRTTNPDIADDRSSTASHYSRLFGKVTAGEAEHDFYGIPLSTDITGHSATTYLGLGALILILLLKPYLVPLPKRKNRALLGNYALDVCLEASFWIGVGTALYFLREVTFYPLLSVIVLTRTSYPYLVVGSHCIVAACSYRAECEENNKQPCHWLTTLLGGFFGYGFGGSIVSDLLMGLPITAMAHARIVPCYLVSYIMVWYCPLDFLYKSYSSNNGNIIRLSLLLAETIDSVTTPMGRISRAARELQNKIMAPLLAGLLAGTGGAMIRYVERVVLQNAPQKAESSMVALEGAVYKTLGISLIWWCLVVQPCMAHHAAVDPLMDDTMKHHCLTYNGSDLLRVILVGVHLIWTIGMECQWCCSHPFIFLLRQGWSKGLLNQHVISFFRLGPYQNDSTAAMAENDDKQNNKRKKE
mmetsp:Transcript_27863/g.42460  ORF Transcript_27863/g.42460 Transcript_27863/m.42460 type:complete len:421 (-) Transcript_27863:1180-2442(-)